ncbi:MAG: hypothetical protein JETCAE03_24940 [Ignavibacteriaceae bacterium]|jgi:hypothetical protein|nr:T9SS type A sorting domain-containing protein [Ignavibacteriaceae bacterium]MEB2298006.1 T9SS type A sorting domain-containing protein [Ignavibacteria bacterium]GJQ42996.1 MAG: hypothetical protein JETCAE03_24940 [Ignavibacteriaceae bacterium]
MKISIIISFYILLTTVLAFPHTQQVHQYIVTEAYQLLVNQWGSIIPEMNNHIGGIGPEFYGDYAWQRPFISTGAWREDQEDPIFNYDFFFVQGVNIALVSITHFWDADDGDLNKNLFPIVLPFPPYPSVNIGPYENAYDKLLRYSNGDWVLWFPDSIWCVNKMNGHQLVIIPDVVTPPARFGIPLKYFSITEFYKYREMNLLSDQNGEFFVFDLTTLQFINPEEAPEIIVTNNIRDRIAWEVLGRMCHLLADQSVPAHTHRDEHGLLADSYENWMGGSSQPYLQWNYTNAGNFINPYTTDNDPLHYLIYTMQQQSDHFGSNGPDEIGNGNNNLFGNSKPQELVFLNSLNISNYGEPTSWNGPWSNTNLENIRDKTFPYAIRATAGLLFWFANEVDLITNIEEAQVIFPIDLILHQNYPNPFNPNTVISYQLPVSSDVTLKIYDVLGNEVATLVDDYKLAGSYEVEFNASTLPSGVYFYQLRTRGPEINSGQGIVETKKMILLK